MSFGMSNLITDQQKTPMSLLMIKMGWMNPKKTMIGNIPKTWRFGEMN